MAQTLLFKELPKLRLTETDASWKVVNSEDFLWENGGRVHSWGIVNDSSAERKREFEKRALEDHDALEVEWVEWDGKTH